MKTIDVAGKPVHIAQSHNQVLEAWEKSPGLNVFSLDYHTDTKNAFINYSYWRADSEAKSGHCSNTEKRIHELSEEKICDYLNNKITLKQINDNLKHDEHLDFAVRTELANLVFVLSTSRNETCSNPNVYILNSFEKYKNQRILEYSPVCVPGCRKEIHTLECSTFRADSLIEDVFLQDAVSKAEAIKSDFFDNYILDIDCDFFNTDQSLYPENIDIFKKLIKESKLITIALEPECVKICRHQGCSLSSDQIVDRLLSVIRESLNRY